MNRTIKDKLNRNLSDLKKTKPKRPRISAFDITPEQNELLQIGYRVWGGQGIGRFIMYCVLDWVKRNV